MSDYLRCQRLSKNADQDPRPAEKPGKKAGNKRKQQKKTSKTTSQTKTESSRNKSEKHEDPGPYIASFGGRSVSFGVRLYWLLPSRSAAMHGYTYRDPKAGPRPRRDQGAPGQAKRTYKNHNKEPKPKENLDGSQQRRKGQGPHGTPCISISTKAMN